MRSGDVSGLAPWVFESARIRVCSALDLLKMLRRPRVKPYPNLSSIHVVLCPTNKRAVEVLVPALLPSTGPAYLAHFNEKK